MDVDVAWLDCGSMTAIGNTIVTPVIAGHAARVLDLTPFQVETVL